MKRFIHKQQRSKQKRILIKLVVALFLGQFLLGGWTNSAITLKTAVQQPNMSTAHAAVISTVMVNSAADPGDGACDANECTLREAITAANAGDTITFDLPTNSMITITGGPFIIDRDLTIDGSTAPGINTAVIGSPYFIISSRIFEISSGVTAVIKHFTISGGRLYGGNGAGVLNNGNLTLVNSTVRNNRAGVTSEGSGNGGGIYNNGRLTLLNSTFNNNSSYDNGGAIYNNGGVVEMLNSTISHNVSDAVRGYGSSGGGIYNTGRLVVVNSTIDSNSVDMIGNGGAILNANGIAEVTNSILTNSRAGIMEGNIYGRNCAGQPIISHGHNVDSDGSCNLTATGDKPNIDPKLGPLTDNGGPTLTQALLPGSPALDAGDNSACPATDQRGMKRPQGSACDIGAYEMQGVFIGSCGAYYVYKVDGAYQAGGWQGAIQVGDNRNNTLTGTSGPNLILGLGGNDLLKGQGGDDVICGGDGVDFVQGNDGNDFLDGGAGNDVLNGGSGDYDQLLGGDGNDVLLDGDGVSNAAGGAGNDILTLVLHKGWRNANGETQFSGLTAGYGNDAVGLLLLDHTSFLLDISGDERDDPPSQLEGNNDALALAGVIDPTSSIVKFEKRLILSADAAQTVPEAEAGAELLTESVGETVAPEQTNRLFLPLITR